MKKNSKNLKGRKEIRNANLVATIKTKLPNVGYVSLDTASNGRKAFVTFRGLDFIISSRLVVKGLTFGRKSPMRETHISEDSMILQNHLDK